MKNIKCEKCNKLIKKTIGVEVKGATLYYIDRERFGNINFYYWYNIRSKKVKKRILNFYCRHCDSTFSKEMEKKIYSWIKAKDVLNKLILS